MVGPPDTFEQVSPVKQVIHHHQQPIFQYAPQLQYAPQPQYFQQVAQATPVVQHQHQQILHHHVPQVQAVAQKVVDATPLAPLGLYASAVGFHTQNSGPTQYLHSYGTQG